MVNFNYTIEDYWNRHIKDVEVDDFGESLDVNLSEEEAVELDDMMGFIIRKYNNEFNCTLNELIFKSSDELIAMISNDNTHPIDYFVLKTKN